MMRDAALAPVGYLIDVAVHRVVGENRGMGELIETNLPFRWDLVTPDQLGSMLAGTTKPDLWFIDDLVQCTGKALARSANGDLVFVGRSLDSMFDLLQGALADLSHRDSPGTSSIFVPTAPRRSGVVEVADTRSVD